MVGLRHALLISLLGLFTKRVQTSSITAKTCRANFASLHTVTLHINKMETDFRYC